MQAFENETREIVRRFLGQELSFPDCIAELDAALARFIPRLAGEQIAHLRAVMFTNNARVMNEMERRAAADQPFG